MGAMQMQMQMWIKFDFYIMTVLYQQMQELVFPVISISTLYFLSLFW